MDPFKPNHRSAVLVELLYVSRQFDGDLQQHPTNNALRPYIEGFV